jgi:hypothetical protein
MLARCARCHGTFEAPRFGVLTCPHCGGEIHLADPAGPAAPPPAPPASPPADSGRPFASEPPPPPPPPPPGGQGPFGGPPPAPPPGELPAPFAERATLGFFRSFFDTWKLAAIQPGEFFRRVRVDQAGSAVLFGVIAFTVGGVFEAFWTSLTAPTMRAQIQELCDRFLGGNPELAQKIVEATRQATSTSAIVNQAVSAPLFGVVLLFAAAAIVHAILVLVKGAGRGFHATLTVLGYVMGLSLLRAIPQCGFPVALIWAAVAAIVGLSEAHRTGTGKGAAAVLLPFLLLCGCACLLAFLALGALGLGAAAIGGGKAL